MSRRSSLIVLAMLSLVGSLLAVSAVPAAGEDGEADDLATYSACVGLATESAGFEDVADGELKAAINCMAHYGIMRATSPGMFSPEVEVTRQAMALFLIRAAGPAGIDVPKARDEGFRDIGDLSDEAQDAINQLAALKITRGKTSRTFAPDGTVTRLQMVLFLSRFLDEAPVGEGGVHIDDVDPDDDQFIDIDEFRREWDDAIRNLFEMGVTQGTSRTRFSPGRNVTRGQMALFISRMLAHTNARPAGVTMQSVDTSVTAGDTAEVVVSVRTSDFEAAPDVSVDLFHAPSRRDAFDSDGRCYDDVTSPLGDDPCVIDYADETTDGLGNLIYDVNIDAGLVLWAWTGNRGERFDEDRTQYASLEFNAGKEAVKFKVTYDFPEEATKVPFGRWVTVIFQLVDEDDNPVREKGVEIRVRSVEKNGNRVDRERTRTHTTDSSGEVRLRFRQTDPDSRDGDPDATLDIYVERHDLDEIDPTPRVQWSDEDDEPNTLVVRQSVHYHQATDSGRGGRHTVTATLYDQYGDPVRGHRVHFTSNDPDGLSTNDDPNRQGEAQNAHRKTTNSRGVATVSYYRDSDSTLTECIDASILGLAPTLSVRAHESGDGCNHGELAHYWVDDPPDDESSGTVRYHDEDRNTLVYDPADDEGPYEISYDSNDQFNYTDTDTNEVKPETFGPFSKGIGTGDMLTVDVQGSSRSSANIFTRA